MATNIVGIAYYVGGKICCGYIQNPMRFQSSPQSASIYRVYDPCHASRITTSIPRSVSCIHMHARDIPTPTTPVVLVSVAKVLLLYALQ
jgi:hypothetical protein